MHSQENNDELDKRISMGKISWIENINSPSAVVNRDMIKAGTGMPNSARAGVSMKFEIFRGRRVVYTAYAGTGPEQ